MVSWPSIQARPSVKQVIEKPRDRYITDAEYQTIYQHAGPIIKAVMEISYCCAARISDVLNIPRERLSETGLYIIPAHLRKPGRDAS